MRFASSSLTSLSSGRPDAGEALDAERVRRQLEAGAPHARAVGVQRGAHGGVARRRRRTTHSAMTDARRASLAPSSPMTKPTRFPAVM